MSATDDLLANNRQYAQAYPAEPPGRPTRAVAVVACMDARMDVYALLGLAPGEAHVLRNAGGEVTDDVLRSLTISQHELGTTEIVLIHHTKCGKQTFSNRDFKHELEADQIGLTYMASAGYDPRESVVFWKRMMTASRGSKPPELMSTHPADDTRINQLERLMPAPERPAVFRNPRSSAITIL
jgi:carbonic anhydrase